jgi:hypothetical protein
MRFGGIFVDSPDYLHTIFDEFFPLYLADNGRPYMDLGMWNQRTGKEIVYLLIMRIFYLNYTGMDIRSIDFVYPEPGQPEIIRIYLRLSDVEIRRESP